jgi:hypothetical protein
MKMDREAGKGRGCGADTKLMWMGRGSSGLREELGVILPGIGYHIST